MVPHPLKEKFRGSAAQIVYGLLHNAHGWGQTIGEIKIVEAKHRHLARNREMKCTDSLPCEPGCEVIRRKDRNPRIHRVEMFSQAHLCVICAFYFIEKRLKSSLAHRLGVSMQPFLNWIKFRLNMNANNFVMTVREQVRCCGLCALTVLADH